MGNAAGPGGNGAASTFGSLERTLDRTIDCLANGEQTREARALLIEARRLRSVVVNWRSIPPPRDVHDEMLSRILHLSTAVGVAFPGAPDAPVREDPQIAVDSSDGGAPDDDADTYSLDFEPHLYSLSADTSARRLAIPPPAEPAQSAPALSPAHAYAAVEPEPERIQPPSLPPAWLPVHDVRPAATPRGKPAPTAGPRDGGSPRWPAEDVRRPAPSPPPAAPPPAAPPPPSPPPAASPPVPARVITQSSVPPPPAPAVITQSSVPPPPAPLPSPAPARPSPAPPALRSPPPAAPEYAALTELPSADPGDDELGAPRTLVTAQAVKLAEPIDPLLLFLTQPYSPRADAYRALRRKFTSSNPARVIAVTSADAAEGKTVFALNFALTLREVARGPVLVVEVNHRAPRMAKLLGFPPTPCFIGQLKSHVDDPRAPWIAAEPLAKLHVMPIDPEQKHPPLLDTVAFSNGMDRLKQAGYEYIIVDSPPVHSGMDCNIIADSVDGLIFTAIPMKSMRKAMRKAVEQLEPAPIFGVVCLES